MMTESRLQTTIRKYLKSKGCYVLVIKPQPGIPDGMPDMLFLLEGLWGAIELKDKPKAKCQPLQEETLEKFNSWSWAKKVDPTNWSTVKEELETIL